MSKDEGRPITIGFLSLVVAAVGFAIFAAIVVFVGARATGLSSSGAKGADAGVLLVIPTPMPGVPLTPKPSPSKSPSTGASTPAGTPSSSTTVQPTSSPTATDTMAAAPITLLVNPAKAKTGQRITLSGFYAAGEGRILTVQQEQSDGSWGDFPVPGVAVAGSKFVTYIELYQAGAFHFRVKDTSDGATSSIATVTVS